MLAVFSSARAMRADATHAGLAVHPGHVVQAVPMNVVQCYALLMRYAKVAVAEVHVMSAVRLAYVDPAVPTNVAWRCAHRIIAARPVHHDPNATFFVVATYAM